MSDLNPVTLSLMLLTTITSVIAFGNRDFFDRWKFNPYSIKSGRQAWRFLTYGALHADMMHLFINMIVLWSFGDMVEQVFRYAFHARGPFLYLLLYLGAVIVSVLPSYYKNRNNPHYNAVGASGAVSAVVFASILFAPTGRIYLFFIPIGIPAFIFGLLYLLYSYIMARKSRGNIGHDAHFWGAVFGLVYCITCKPAFVLKFWHQVLGFLNGFL